MRRFLAGWVLVIGLTGPGWAEAAPDHASDRPAAVIFAYGRFDDESSTNSIRSELFLQHLRELTRGNYHVMALPDIVAALKSGQNLPDRTVAITIDDTHSSVYRVAWPLLKALGLPFTLFVATDEIDADAPDQMSWDQISEMADAGVTIGNMTAGRDHLIGQDRAYVVGQIERANERLRDELGQPAVLFAYPYGEDNNALRGLVAATGFDAAFTTNSGVASSLSNPFALPRFIMNDSFGSLDRFQMAASAEPLSIHDMVPDDTVVNGANPPPISFTVDEQVGDLDQLACFGAGIGTLDLTRQASRRIEIQLTDALPQGRTRINCTLPDQEEDARWRWLGIQLFVP